MKILLVIPQLGYGGAETSLIRLANALGTRHEVTVACFTAGYGLTSYAAGHAPLNVSPVILDDAVPRHQLSRWWRRFRRLRQLKAANDATISFLSGPNLLNIACGYWRRSIVSVRGSRRYDPLQPYHNRFLFTYLIDPIIYAAAARIVPVSPGLIHEIRALPWRKVAHKCVVIPPFFTPRTDTACEPEPAPPLLAALAGQPVLCVAGRLSVEKGVLPLLRVFRSLAHEAPGAKLLLLGDGPARGAIEAYCAEANLPLNDPAPGVTSVLLVGYQPNPAPWLALARALVLPSLTEGCPNGVLEALAAGLPVIANDAPWGARAILYPAIAETVNPYPTTAPRVTPLGTLLPRIDDAANDAIWVTTLREYLEHPRTPDAAALTATLKRYCQARAVEDWEGLVGGVGA
jgi:glycosyltransferase involved in cell wall biosynthesis